MYVQRLTTSEALSRVVSLFPSTKKRERFTLLTCNNCLSAYSISLASVELHLWRASPRTTLECREANAIMGTMRNTIIIVSRCGVYTYFLMRVRERACLLSYIGQLMGADRSTSWTAILRFCWLVSQNKQCHLSRFRQRHKEYSLLCFSRERRKMK